MLKPVIAAGLLAAATNVACAAPPEFCASYAAAAVRQAEVAHRVPPCAPGAIGTRWSVQYGVHYGWCITAPFAAADRERAIRTRYLRSCRG